MEIPKELYQPRADIKVLAEMARDEPDQDTLIVQAICELTHSVDLLRHQLKIISDELQEQNSFYLDKIANAL